DVTAHHLVTFGDHVFDGDVEIGHGFVHDNHHLFVAVDACRLTARTVVVVEVSRHISPNGRGIPLVDEIFKVISYLFFHLIGSQAGGQGVLLNGETSTNL